MIRTKFLLASLLLGTLCLTLSAQQPDEPTKKLGAFLGKWKTEGAFATGQKTSTTLECRWSPMGSYLVCDQLVNMGGGEHRQFTVYSYDSKSGNYSYTTLADPGASPAAAQLRSKETSGSTTPVLKPTGRQR